MSGISMNLVFWCLILRWLLFFIWYLNINIVFQLFEHCLAADTMGDGTGCDNMTAVLVKLKPLFATISAESANEGSSSAGSKRQATDNEEDDKQESKKLKLEEEKVSDKEEETSLAPVVDAASTT